MKRLSQWMVILITSINFAYGATAKPLRVLLDWLPNADHVPLYVALDRGYFSEQGWSVELVTPTDPSLVMKMVSSKKIDIGLTYQPSLLVAQKKKLPVQAIATLVDSPMNCLLVRKDSGIVRLSDLSGKKIAAETWSDYDRAVMNFLLKHARLTAEDVTWLSVHYNLVQALLTRQVDAVMGVMRNIEPYELSAWGVESKCFYPEKYGWPDYDELIFVTNSERVNSPQAIAFKKALKKSIQYVRAHPEESWQYFIKHHPQLDTAANREMWQATLPLFAEHPERVNSQKLKALAGLFVTSQ